RAPGDDPHRGRPTAGGRRCPRRLRCRAGGGARARRHRQRIGAQPLHRDRDAGRQGQGGGAGGDARRAAPHGLADDTRGGRRAGSRARRPGCRLCEGNQRRDRGPVGLMKRAFVALAALAVLLFEAAPTASAGNKPSGEITVFAAAPLPESFARTAKKCEKKSRDVDVKFDYAASSTPPPKINQGARADVFAPADVNNLKKTTAAGPVAPPPQDFATNRL